MSHANIRSLPLPNPSLTRPTSATVSRSLILLVFQPNLALSVRVCGTVAPGILDIFHSLHQHATLLRIPKCLVAQRGRSEALWRRPCCGRHCAPTDDAFAEELEDGERGRNVDDAIPEAL